jgi:CRP/FNR family transcriptional regulator, anaerobic regulatory protein
MDNLNHLTSKLVGLTIEEFNDFKKLFVAVDIKKMDHLFSEGDCVRELYFINNGLLRGYYIKEGQEFRTNFFYGPIFATDIFAIRNKSKTLFNIQAVKNCECYKANFEDVEELMEKHPNIRIMLFKFYELIYMNAVDTKTSFLFDSQQERYLKLLQQEPELFKDIPLHYIASYLGIKPETLSRIRKKLKEPV